MLQIDTITIIICTAVILLSIIGSLVNPFFRKVKRDNASIGEDNDENSTEEELKPVPVTVLITAHDNAAELNRNLPQILHQDYPNFQVIVVAEKGDNETEDLLKRFNSDPHLYTTFIPESSRYMSRKKLAITLGIKAASSEWILLTEPQLTPVSDKWIAAMASHFKEGCNLVLGYTQFDNNTSDYRHFEHLRRAWYYLRRAQKSIAVCTNMANIAFRKSEFLSKNGFQGDLQLIRGEYDFIVNKYARKNSTAVELSNKSWLTEQCPSDKTWNNRHMYFLASLPSLHRVRSLKALNFIDHLFPHISLLASLAAIICGVLFQNWLILGAGVLALLLLFFLRMIIAKNAMHSFEENIPAIRLPFYEYSLIWRALAGKLRYMRSDKLDFTSHKQ